ncbi:MAG: K+-transporting ATPase, KdpA, partial [Candidatus Aminicenantes bacterium]|nr:K+-transporting ATPase, KdpA [Candidatus Aminicenantes bacterium]
MDLSGWLQLALFVGLLFAVAKPVGLYLVRVLEPDGKTWLDRPLKPVERFLYRLLGVDPKIEQDWRHYTRSLIIFSLAGLLFTYAVLRLQHLLPLNPQGFGAVPPDLAFNTAASFASNTNWQNYAGETTLSHFSQMVGLVFHNFVSAAAGIAVAAALVRGIGRHSSKTVGNFWADLVRINLYLLLPLSIVFSAFLTSQGTIQNFKPAVEAVTVEGRTTQTIAQGPAASQVAIKMLGTNGGGFFNANAAHPYEDPTPLSNFVQMLAILLIPSGLTYYLGRKVKNQKHGWAVWSAMAVLFLAAALICWKAEADGNARMRALGVHPAAGNMEGKEVRFGVPGSSLFAT